MQPNLKYDRNGNRLPEQNEERPRSQASNRSRSNDRNRFFVVGQRARSRSASRRSDGGEMENGPGGQLANRDTV